MMSSSFDPRKKARKNVNTLVGASVRFPRNVFVGEWSHYRFFDPDWMFDEDFVFILQEMLIADPGEVACVASLDNAIQAADEGFCFVDKRTTAEMYRQVLWHEDGIHGWLSDYGRFACAGDSGSWCFYCERNEDIGVLALRAPGDLDRFAVPLRRLPTLNIVEAIREPLTYYFGTMLDAWKVELPQAYAVPETEHDPTTIPRQDVARSRPGMAPGNFLKQGTSLRSTARQSLVSRLLSAVGRTVRLRWPGRREVPPRF